MTEGGIEDYELPKAVIGRILKHALPDGTIVQKEAKMGIYKAATVFVSYITAIASDLTTTSNKKTIGANEIFRALEIAEFDTFNAKLQNLLATYREANAVKKNKKAKVEEPTKEEAQ